VSLGTRRMPWPVGCHQTIKANIRFHLYGGPQGWNPHSFGPERTFRQVINPSESVRPETTFAFPRTPRYYLRASNRARMERGRHRTERRGECISPRETRRASLSFASPRIARYYLRASNRARSESRPAVGGMRRLPENRAAPLSFAFHRNALLHLRASNRPRDDVGSNGTRGRQSVASGAPSHLTSFASHPSAGVRKTPSNQRRFDTRPHAKNPRTEPVSRGRRSAGRPARVRSVGPSGTHARGRSWGTT